MKRLLRKEWKSFKKCNVLFQKTKALTAKDAKSLRQERKDLHLRNFFFAPFAKTLCDFALKNLLTPPLLIAFFLFNLSFTLVAQNPPPERSGFSLSNRNAALHDDDHLLHDHEADTTNISNISAFRLTELGDRYAVPMDTSRLNTANSMLVDGQSVAIAYTGNIGSPSQSRIFSERKEERDFIFADAYDFYIITPQNGLFYDTKIPYSHVTYNRAGGALKREEQLKILLTSNFGKKINVGWDFDYIYSRGFYNSNGNKILNYRFFGNYLSDRYQAHAYIRNANIVNSENGGLMNDRNITHPDDFGAGRPPDTKDFITRMSDTWNRVRGQNFYLTHRYNLGFYRELTDSEKERKEQQEIERERQREAEAAEQAENPDSEQQPATNDDFKEDPHANEVFVPVSSIIHTFEYEDNSRRFISNGSLDALYPQMYGSPDSVIPNDFTLSWKLKNTVALSLREGFQDWVKAGFTAFIFFEKRHFSLPGLRPSFISSFPAGITSSGPVLASDLKKYDEFSTFIGAELAKKQGSLLTYDAHGELCILGSDLGEFRLNGNIQSKFPILGKTASLQATGYIKNIVPAFYQRHFHSRYFWWDANLKNVQRVFVGGTVALEQTKTQLTVGVESIQNFVYFDSLSMPRQYDSNLQVITGRFKQDFRYKALGWENEIVYQISSNTDVLPLPQLSAYTNLYVTFKLVKVLSVQLGADVHYHTSYYAPYYEPATQQFLQQDETKIGNYPLINAYANFHLKQARFFLTAYNLGSILIDNPAYFSMPHYPLNPMVIKMGVSVMFNN